MSSDVETIKNRLSVVDVLGSYIKLQKAGINYKARCPFHNEKTPSFFVSPERGSFYCFGCGAKGDIFTFVERFEGLDFVGALKALAERAGVEIKEISIGKKNQNDELYLALEKATGHFQEELLGRRDVLDYLLSRGLSEETIKKFRIGYAKKDWRELVGYLRSINVSDSAIERSGLGKLGDKGLYDRFRGRIMFPITDTQGRVVAFSGRIFEVEKDDKGEPLAVGKYINSPETSLYSKSKILFGMDKAKEGIRKWSFAILVEGQMDLLLAHQIGYTNTIALSGTALTPEQISLIKRFTPRLVLSLDRDPAGLLASGKSAGLALSEGIDVKVATLPEGKDPADIIKGSPEVFKEAIKKSIHVVDFYLAILELEGYDERKFRLEVSRIVLPLIAKIQSNIDRAHFISRVAETLRLGESAIISELSRIKDGDETETPKERIESRILPRKDEIIKRLLGIALLNKNKEELLQRIGEIIGNGSLEGLLQREDFLTEAVFEIERFNLGKEEIDKEINSLFLSLKRDILSEKRKAIQEEIKKKEKLKENTNSLMEEFQILSKEITSLDKNITS